MGLFGKLLSSIGGGSRRSCPDCQEDLWAESGELSGRYECHNDSCNGWRFYFNEGGTLVDPPNRGKSSGGGTCRWCQSALSAGTSCLPHEEGGNSHAYIVCPSCSQENIQYGFDEEDY